MCIIIHKKPEAPFPSDKVLTHCLQTHKDGFGAMWRYGKSICIIKGLYKLDQIKSILSKIPKDSEAAFHFRMATHGHVSAGNCHPFPISDRNDALQTTAGVFDTGLMHNGIISGFGYRNTSSLSDTMNFIKYLCNATGKIYTMPKIDRHIKSHYGKFIVFTPDWTYTWGAFINDGGLLYSNSTYKDFTYLPPVRGIYDNYNDKYNDKHSKDSKKEFKDYRKKGRRYIPIVVEVNPELLSWVEGRETATYYGVEGSVIYYKGVTIFCEEGFDKNELEILMEEINLSVMEGEYEGINSPP